VTGVDARRATPPDPRLARWGLAGCRQLDPSHPALVTREDPGVEPCPEDEALMNASCRLLDGQGLRALSYRSTEKCFTPQVTGPQDCRAVRRSRQPRPLNWLEPSSHT